MKRVLALDPNATVAKWAAQQPYKNPADLEHYKDGLRKAGLPQGGLKPTKLAKPIERQSS